MAGRVTLSKAAVFEHEDLFADRTAQVAADQAADGPAHRLVSPAEVQQVLLGLVAGQQGGSGLRQRIITRRLYAEQTLQRVDSRPGAAPVPATAIPRSSRAAGMPACCTITTTMA